MLDCWAWQRRESNQRMTATGGALLASDTPEFRWDSARLPGAAGGGARLLRLMAVRSTWSPRSEIALRRSSSDLIFLSVVEGVHMSRSSPALVRLHSLFTCVDHWLPMRLSVCLGVLPNLLQ